ncbi:MAG: hypothetical protein JWM59_3903 [Verrucomicrobiales bacterium]|nr:hypothetical protein [Verrucomicrobiales bacterium]
MSRTALFLRRLMWLTVMAVALIHAGCAAVPGSHPPSGAEGADVVSRAAEAWAQWSGRLDNPEMRRRCDRTLRRLVKWVDRVPMDRRESALQAAGLVMEMDRLEEEGVNRFTPADEVDQSVLLHCHRREGTGLPVVAWRANDGSGRWDSLRPPEGLLPRRRRCWTGCRMAGRDCGFSRR